MPDGRRRVGGRRPAPAGRAPEAKRRGSRPWREVMTEIWAGIAHTG